MLQASSIIREKRGPVNASRIVCRVSEVENLALRTCTSHPAILVSAARVVRTTRQVHDFLPQEERFETPPSTPSPRFVKVPRVLMR